MHFGELALLRERSGGLRNATVICSKKSSFATLSLKDYKWTIGQEEKRKLKEIVAFFRGFRIFSNLRTNAIEDIFYFMKSIEFIRGQKIYCEGVDTINGIYFIHEGEFEITQKLDTDKTKVEQKTAKKALSRSISFS